MKYKWFYDEVYEQNYTVILKPSIAEIKKFLLKNFKWSLDMREDVAASTFATPNDHLIFVFFKKTDPYIVSHECSHAAIHVFEMRGATIWDGKAAESYCYYQGWLVKKVTQALKELK